MEAQHVNYAKGYCNNQAFIKIEKISTFLKNKHTVEFIKSIKIFDRRLNIIVY